MSPKLPSVQVTKGGRILFIDTMAAVMDSRHSLFLAGLFHVSHTFRMATFFLLSGFFGPMSLHKKGLDAFVADQLRRHAGVQMRR